VEWGAAPRGLYALPSALQVPRFASGIWWSRWYDVNNKDVLDVVEAYDSNRVPLDVYVLDMDVSSRTGGTPLDVYALDVDGSSRAGDTLWTLPVCAEYVCFVEWGKHSCGE